MVWLSMHFFLFMFIPLSLFATTALSLLPCSTHATANTNPTMDLHIVNALVSPDGFNRSAVLANGQLPGPIISGFKGDEFNINVINELSDTSMAHWHGIFQRGTNWADGPAFVTQCPITPGNSFQYKFSVPDQAGTFWYHSHFQTQYCDGLRGPLIIYDRNDPHQHLYDVDDASTILTISDWYHVPSSGQATTRIPTADATLFNGLGRYNRGPLSPLYVLYVEPGKRYRIRLIGMACDPNYQFSIDGHTMTIIEADGESTQPLEVSSLQLFAGQRYSFVLNANQKPGNYWIRANPSIGDSGFIKGINSAILRYKGAPEVEPKTLQPLIQKPLKESDLEPYVNPAAPGRPGPGAADINLNLAFTFNNSMGRFTTNGISFQPPTVPVLLQILSGAQPATDLLPSGAVYTLPSNKVIEISMPAGVVGGPHPFHLHGHAFSVIRSAGSTAYNYETPVRRDVVNIGGPGDNVTVRFVTDNTGPWFLHCHVDYHLDLGLAIVFAEDTQQMITEPVPDAWKNLCPSYESYTAQHGTQSTGLNSLSSAPQSSGVSGPQPSGPQPTGFGDPQPSDSPSSGLGVPPPSDSHSSGLSDPQASDFQSTGPAGPQPGDSQSSDLNGPQPGDSQPSSPISQP